MNFLTSLFGYGPAKPITPQTSPSETKHEKTQIKTHPSEASPLQASPQAIDKLKEKAIKVVKENQPTIQKVEGVFARAQHQIQEFFKYIKEKIVSFSHHIRLEGTEVKIQQLFITAVSAYLFVGARAVAGGLIPQTFGAFIGAAPLFAAASGLLWYATTLTDYGSQTSLKEIRKQAPHLPFPHLLKAHGGFQKIFQHKILAPEEFKKGYNAFRKTLSLKEEFRLYEAATQALGLVKTAQTDCPYQIPHPSESKEKFLQETKNTPLHKIPDAYSLDDLERHGVLSPNQVHQIEQARQNAKELSEKTISNKQEVATLGRELLKRSNESLKAVKEQVKSEESAQEKLKSFLKTSEKRTFLPKEKEEFLSLMKSFPGSDLDLERIEETLNLADQDRFASQVRQKEIEDCYLNDSSFANTPKEDSQTKTA